MEKHTEERQCLAGVISVIMKPKTTETFDTIIDYVFTLRTYDQKLITCYGKSFELFVGENVKVFGKLVSKPGKKDYFKFEEVKVDFDNMKSNDFFNKVFGRETYDKFKKQIKKEELVKALNEENFVKLGNLMNVSSTSKKIERVLKTYNKIKGSYIAFEKLSKYGLSLKDVQKACKIATIEEVEKTIKNNPFKMIQQFGFSFNQCDIINAHENNSFISAGRMCAGVVEALREEYMSGNTYTSKDNIVKRALSILNVEGLYSKKEDITINKIESFLKILISKKRIINDDGRYYLSYVFAMEERLRGFCKKVLSEKEIDIPTNKIKEYIKNYETIKGFNLGKEQKEAVINSLQHRVSIITGGAGTGKTSSLAVIVKYFLEHGYSEKQIALCSPTGKAAQRMMESINGQLKSDLKASTIHVLLGAKGTSIEEFTYNEEHKLDCDIVVVDETSMMDLTIAYALMTALKDSCKIIFLGDIDQLPPVMAGYFLRDLIDSKIPCVKLLEIHRQKGDSSIIGLSLGVKANTLTVEGLKKKNDFLFKQQTENFEENLNWLVESYLKFYNKTLNEKKREFSEKFPNQKITKEISRAIEEKTLDEIMIVTPLRDTKSKAEPTMNAQLISNKIQEKLFENYKGVRFQKNGYEFKVGSKIIISKNNNDKGLTNGQIGYIRDIDLENKTVTIFSDGKTSVLDDEDVNNLLLAYAITVHKSQGSEWKCCFYCCFKETRMNQRNLVYTALTRAKKYLIVFGDKETFLKSPTNLGATKRSRLLN